MKNKFKKYYLPFSILRDTVLICCGGGHKDFEKEYAKFARMNLDDVPKSEHAIADGRTIFCDGYISMWCLKPIPSIVAHEANHVAFRMLEAKGIAHDEELMAYLVQWIVKEYLRIFKK